jgi:DNA polymerase-3 subunit epsilon
LVKDFMLDEELCFFARRREATREEPAIYNVRVREAIETLQQQLPTFALMGRGKCANEQSCLLVERGRFYGMGYVPGHYHVSDINELKLNLTQYPDNDYVRGLVYEFAERNPGMRREL